VVAKSDNAIVSNSVFYADGKLIIVLKPFDNIIKITIASNILSQNNILTPSYMDLTGLGNIQLVFKNNKLVSSFDIYQNTGEIDLANGTVVFKISTSKINDIRSIYNSGVNIFYIVSTQNSTTSVIYSGLFKLYDSIDNINNMNAVANQLLVNTSDSKVKSSIITDNSANTGVAIVTRTLKNSTKNSVLNSGVVNANGNVLNVTAINKNNLNI
jgi:hypothetical protein